MRASSRRRSRTDASLLLVSVSQEFAVCVLGRSVSGRVGILGWERWCAPFDECHASRCIALRCTSTCLLRVCCVCCVFDGPGKEGAVRGVGGRLVCLGLNDPVLVDGGG